MKNSAISAVVPAAGLSKRMGRFKPLLPLGPSRTIERVVSFFQAADVDDILVVTGHRAAEVRAVIEPLDVRCVENPEYRQGMFTSVQAGIRALSGKCRAFFIHPADTPLVRPQTVRRLMTAFRDASATILYPTFSGLRGHPTLIDIGLGPGILEWSGGGGLSAFLQHHEAESLELPVREISLGAWEGQRFKTVQTLYPQAFQERGDRIADYRPPGGESFRDLQARIWPVFEAIARRFPGHTLIVTHTGVIRVLLCRLLGMPLENLFCIRQTHGALNIIELRPENWRIQAINLQSPFQKILVKS